MIDTISFNLEVKAPEEFYKQVPYPISFGKFRLNPEYNGNFVRAYTVKHRNLKISLTANQAPILKITNSLHKYFKGNNFSDFTFSEINDALFKLEYDLNRPIFTGKIIKLDYGLNLDLDAEKVYPYFKSYKGNEFNKMKSKGKTYGAKVILSQSAIKGYNKTLENNRNRNALEKLKTNIFRFEIEVRKMIHLRKRTKSIPIMTVRDLLDVKNYQLLREDILNKYDHIRKDIFIDLAKLTIGEKKTLATMKDEQIKLSVKRDHKDSYKKCRAVEKNIYRNADDTFFSKEIRSRMSDKLDELIYS